jgi:hypothetical protein
MSMEAGLVVVLALCLVAVCLIWILGQRIFRSSSGRGRATPMAGGHRRRRNNTSFSSSDDDAGDDFDADDSDSDRLLRAADRFENAGDSARAQQARAAAADVDAGVSSAATTLAMAEFLDSGTDSGSSADSSSSSSSSDNS